MTRRVPVVVLGTGPVAARFRALVAERADMIAGVTGLVLDVRDGIGPESSVLVDTLGALEPMMEAVQGGHAAVTSHLAELVAHPAEFAVLRSDGRLGLSGALLPGIPLADTLMRMAETGDVVESVELTGASARELVHDALAVCALLGVHLKAADVVVDEAPAAEGGWRARIGARAPVLSPDPAPATDGVRSVTIVSAGTGCHGLRFSGAVGGEDRVAGALLADLVALAKQEDTPWRAHRRLRAAPA